jgi:hypothetical protein
VTILSRLLSVIALIILILPYAAGSLAPLIPHSAYDALLTAFFPLGVAAGLVSGWRRPLVGGLMILISIASSAAIHFAASRTPPSIFLIIVFSIPAAAFIVTSRQSRTSPRTSARQMGSNGLDKATDRRSVSSGWVFFLKYPFPIGWIGFWAVGTYEVLLHAESNSWSTRIPTNEIFLAQIVMPTMLVVGVCFLGWVGQGAKKSRRIVRVTVRIELCDLMDRAADGHCCHRAIPFLAASDDSGSTVQALSIWSSVSVYSCCDEHKRWCIGPVRS